MAISEINQGGGGDFTTIAGFEAAAAYGDVGQITDAGGTVYAETVTWSGASGTGSDTNRLRLEATNEHLGVPGAGIIQRSTGGHVNTIQEEWLHFLGFEVQQNGSGSSDEGFRTSGSNTLFERLIVNANSLVSDQDGIYLDGALVSGVVIVNCIIYGFRRAGVHNSDATVEIHFGTFDDFAETAESSDGPLRQGGTSADTTTYNTSYTRNADENDIQVDGGVISGSNNASSDTSVTDQSVGTLDNLNVATAFTDADARDYSLAGSSALEGAGVDRTGSPPSQACDLTVDIAGTTRPATPSIGAFDVAAAAGTTVEFDLGVPLTAEKAIGTDRQINGSWQRSASVDLLIALSAQRAAANDAATPFSAAATIAPAHGFHVTVRRAIDASRRVQAGWAGEAALAASADVPVAWAREVTHDAGIRTSHPAAMQADGGVAVSLLRQADFDGSLVTTWFREAETSVRIPIHPSVEVLRGTVLPDAWLNQAQTSQRIPTSWEGALAVLIPRTVPLGWQATVLAQRGAPSSSSAAFSSHGTAHLSSARRAGAVAAALPFAHLAERHRFAIMPMSWDGPLALAFSSTVPFSAMAELEAPIAVRWTAAAEVEVEREAALSHARSVDVSVVVALAARTALELLRKITTGWEGVRQERSPTPFVLEQPLQELDVAEPGLLIIKRAWEEIPVTFAFDLWLGSMSEGFSIAEIEVLSASPAGELDLTAAASAEIVGVRVRPVAAAGQVGASYAVTCRVRLTDGDQQMISELDATVRVR